MDLAMKSSDPLFMCQLINSLPPGFQKKSPAFLFMLETTETWGEEINRYSINNQIA
jgi:hypothetical protein